MDLKPCPFCGSSDLELDNLGDDDSWAVECKGCHAQQQAIHWKAQAVAAWNRRAEPVQAVDTVAAYNAIFDPADEAGQDVFSAGFREGWLLAAYPDGPPGHEEADDEYGRAVDGVVLGEAWDAHRDAFFARLPLAALPPRPR